LKRAAVVLAGAIAGGATIVHWQRRPKPVAAKSGVDPVSVTSRWGRNAEVARLSSQLGTTYVTHRARRAFASAEHQEALDRALELRTAEQVVEALGSMKGALMKIGQMASYLDEGLPEGFRTVLSQLQQNAPPMSSELAAGVIESELGRPPHGMFLEWDPVPIAAASIGQVHRAITPDGTAVAVKVQYPGVADAVSADLANTDMLFNVMAMVFPGLDPGPLVDELRGRLSEELDYIHEAANQRRFVAWYRDHPFIHIPDVIDELSTARVLTTELAQGARFDTVAQSWSPAERDLAAEAIFRFVFRSLNRMDTFNGDPHPGNYLFRPGGHVSFLDFGLVKHFEPQEIMDLQGLLQAIVLRRDIPEFRRRAEAVGLLKPGAPVTDDEVRDYFEPFYEMILHDRVWTVTPEYASATMRRLLNPSHPVIRHTNLPPPFVLIQRINMGLMAVLAQLDATANWRRIGEELWPFVNGPPSSELGRLEADWMAGHGR